MWQWRFNASEALKSVRPLTAHSSSVVRPFTFSRHLGRKVAEPFFTEPFELKTIFKVWTFENRSHLLLISSSCVMCSEFRLAAWGPWDYRPIRLHPKSMLKCGFRTNHKAYWIDQAYADENYRERLIYWWCHRKIEHDFWSGIMANSSIMHCN